MDGGVHLRFEISAERFLDELTEATVSASLRSRKGKMTPGHLRASLKRALKAVLRKDLQVNERCGSHVIGICSHAPRTDLWPAKKKETP